MNKPAEPHKVLARISSHFIGEFALNEAIEKSFKELGQLTGAGRVYLYRIHHKAKLAHVTQEWVNINVPGISGSITSFALGEFSWLISNLEEKDIVLVEDLNDLPEEASNEKQTLLDQKIKSFICFPFRKKEKLEGLIGLDFGKSPLSLSSESLEILKIAVDIIGISMESKLSETSLRKSEKLYESIYENTGAATLTIRPDTGISMVNSEFERLTGYLRRQVEGKMRLIDLVVEEDQHLIKQYHHLLMSNPAAVPRNYEFNYITSKEITRTAYMTGSSLLDTKNCVISFIDITEFKETEKQLIDAKDKAEESDRLKSAFLANVSHEIRTPLNAITGFSALLSNSNLHFDKKEKYIKYILKGSNELVSLIDNVLDLSRIESGQVELERKIHETR